MGRFKQSFAAWCRQSGREKLLALYDAEASGISAEEIACSSATQRKWRCPVCGIAWESSTNKMNRLALKHYNVIFKRREDTYCPCCKGERASPLYNITTEVGWAERFWDPERNTGEADRLELYTPGSKKKFYFRCPDCGYRFPQPIRVLDDLEALRCPECGDGRSREVTDGNCLAAKYPKISKELADALNGGLTGSMIRPSFRERKLWFQCARGHLYQAWVYNRAYRQDGCPHCNSRRRTSFIEQAFFYYLQKCSWNVRNNCLDPHDCSVDILLPDLKTAVEYDSLYYHATVLEREEALTRARSKCLNLSQYYRVYVLTEWEEEAAALLELNSPLIIPIQVPVFNYSKKLLAAYSQAIYEFLRSIFPQRESYPNVDIQRDELKILAQYIKDPAAKSFQQQYPHLAQDWDWMRNGTLRPDMFPPNAPYRFYWVCRSCRRSYLSTIYNRRHINPERCSYCTRKSRYPGTMLHECFPQLEYFWEKGLNRRSFYETAVASEEYGIFSGPKGRIVPVKVCNFSDWLWNNPGKSLEAYLELLIRRRQRGREQDRRG